eukprot:6304852-Pyramimonas_sp.AAC.1
MDVHKFAEEHLPRIASMLTIPGAEPHFDSGAELDDHRHPPDSLDPTDPTAPEAPALELSLIHISEPTRPEPI